MVSVEVKDKDLDYISKEAKHITALTGKEPTPFMCVARLFFYNYQL